MASGSLVWKITGREDRSHDQGNPIQVGAISFLIRSILREVAAMGEDYSFETHDIAIGAALGMEELNRLQDVALSKLLLPKRPINGQEKALLVRCRNEDS